MQLQRLRVSERLFAVKESVSDEFRKALSVRANMREPGERGEAGTFIGDAIRGSSSKLR